MSHCQCHGVVSVNPVLSLGSSSACDSGLWFDLPQINHLVCYKLLDQRQRRATLMTKKRRFEMDLLLVFKIKSCHLICN